MECRTNSVDCSGIFRPHQVLRYRPGEHYGPHWDLFEADSLAGADGERLATVVMYLNTPEEGGETAFTSADPGPEWHERRGGRQSWSECGRSGLSMRPVKGDALLFYSLTPSIKKDDLSMHASCPPKRGEKWVAIKWIHTKPVIFLFFFFGNTLGVMCWCNVWGIDTVSTLPSHTFHLLWGPVICWDGAMCVQIEHTPPPDFLLGAPFLSNPSRLQFRPVPGIDLPCDDTHDSCKSWAAAGECDRNVAFMKGFNGVCKKACGVC